MFSRFRSARHDDEAGFTLVEVLVTMAIMAIGVVVVFGAIGTFLTSTRVHRASADLDAAMRTYVERIDAAAYVDCATATSYNGVAPTGFTPSIQVRYWDGTPAPAGYVATCPSTDQGQQQLTVTLTRNSDNRQDSLVIVKRDEVQP